MSVRRRTNWARNVDIGAAPVARPASLDEVRRTVAQSRRLRVLGAGHSFSGILPTEGTVLCLDRLAPAVDIDPGAGIATVSAGMRYTEVAHALHQAGYALANLASLTDITVAGACATATHGSGDSLRVLAAAVTGMQLVGPEGDVSELSRETGHDTFDGAVVSLGALGVVTRLTLRIEPSYEVTQTVRAGVPLDEIRDDIDAVLGGAYSASVFTTWGDDAAVWLKRRTDQPLAAAEFGSPAAGPLNPVPGADPAPCTDQSGAPGPWHRRLPHIRPGTVPRAGGELQSEYLVPRTATAAAFTALRGLRAALAPILQVSEVRTVRGDDLWLSPAYRQDSVAFHFTWINDTARVKPVIAEVERALGPLGARPHWAKLTGMPASRIRSLYPRAADFAELVAKHDPEGTFTNPFLDALLTP